MDRRRVLLGAAGWLPFLGGVSKRLRHGERWSDHRSSNMAMNGTERIHSSNGNGSLTVSLSGEPTDDGSEPDTIMVRNTSANPQNIEVVVTSTDGSSALFRNAYLFEPGTQLNIQITEPGAYTAKVHTQSDSGDTTSTATTITVSDCGTSSARIEIAGAGSTSVSSSSIRSGC